MIDIEFGKELSYKEMCEVMNDEYKDGGKNRDLQLRKWRQYYDVEKIKTKYVVVREYTEEEQHLTANHGKFTTYIENLLVDHLRQVNQIEVTMTYREILEALWMVNEKYYPTKYGQNQIEIKAPQDYDEYLLRYNQALFFDISNKLLKRLIDNAIENMEDRSLIIANKSYRLFKKEVDNCGNMIIKKYDCTDSDISKILDAQFDGLKLVGVKTKQELFYLSKQNRQEYYDYVLDRIQKEFGYDSYAQSIKMICVKNIKFRATFSLNKLNSGIVNKLLTSKSMGIIPKNFNEQMIDELIKK